MTREPESSECSAKARRRYERWLKNDGEKKFLRGVSPQHRSVLLLVNLKLAVQSMKVPREPILTTEK